MRFLGLPRTTGLTIGLAMLCACSANDGAEQAGDMYPLLGVERDMVITYQSRSTINGVSVGSVMKELDVITSQGFFRKDGSIRKELSGEVMIKRNDLKKYFRITRDYDGNLVRAETEVIEPEQVGYDEMLFMVGYGWEPTGVSSSFAGKECAEWKADVEDGWVKLCVTNAGVILAMHSMSEANGDKAASSTIAVKIEERAIPSSLFELPTS